jgi:hypothetical protein
MAMGMNDDTTRHQAGPGNPASDPGRLRAGGHPRGDRVPIRYVDDATTYRSAAPRPVVEPSQVFEPPMPKRSRGDSTLFADMGLVLFLVAAIVAGFATWSFAGRLTSDLFAASPTSTPARSLTPPSPTASPSATAALQRTPTPSPPATDEPPVREPTTVNIEASPKKVFVSELRKTWCAAAAVQIVLNINGPKIDTSLAYQTKINKLERTSTTRTDSRNGGVGPLGMVETLNQMGEVQYELRIYDTQAEALHDTARAVSATGNPVILLAWRGAHAWVMTGFKADADPTLFDDAKISGTYILDPWYPRVSSIWGRSDAPGTFQNAAEMKRNYPVWHRPEGRYPDRDGRYLAIVPAAAP